MLVYTEFGPGSRTFFEVVNVCVYIYGGPPEPSRRGAQAGENRYFRGVDERPGVMASQRGSPVRV
jgi:hypothetical protein